MSSVTTSMLATRQLMFLCINEKIRECIREYAHLKSEGSRASKFCGWFINERDTNIKFPMTQSIKVIANFEIRVDFFKFDTPRLRKSCPCVGMILLEDTSRDNPETICGNRLPWVKYTNSNSLEVQFYAIKPYAPYISVVYFYEVFRKNTAINMYNLEKYSFARFKVQLETLRLAGSSQSLEWHIVAHPFSYLQLSLEQIRSVQRRYGIFIYDGPGNKSPLLTTNTTFNFLLNSTAFHVTIKVLFVTNSPLLLLGRNYITYTSLPFTNSPSSSHNNCKTFPRYVRSATINVGTRSSQSANTVCFIKFFPEPPTYDSIYFSQTDNLER